MDEEHVKRLVRAARDDDDRDAFNRLVLQYQERVYNDALRWFGDEPTASDITQDTFIRAWTKINTFSYNRFPSFYAWMIAIARNLCRDEWRKQKRREEEKEEAEREHGLARQHVSAGDELEKSERQEALINCIDRLPEKYRTVILLARKSGMKRREITYVLGVNVNIVGGRIRRGEKLLRDCLCSRFRDLFDDYCR